MQNLDSKRPYHSPRRQEQAQATRQKILDAARRLFNEHGYVATTLPTIAREAGVSAPTVSAVFGTKLALLDTLINISVRGDQGPEQLAMGVSWEEMLREPDPARQIRRFAENALRIHERLIDIYEIVRGAAAADSVIESLRREHEARRFQALREIVESLDAKRALRPSITVEEATDLLWTLGSSEQYRMLVLERGWTPEMFEAWLAQTLQQQLLPA